MILGQTQYGQTLVKQQQANETQISFGSDSKTTPITPNLKYQGSKFSRSACVRILILRSNAMHKWDTEKKSGGKHCISLLYRLRARLLGPSSECPVTKCREGFLLTVMHSFIGYPAIKSIVSIDFHWLVESININHNGLLLITIDYIDWQSMIGFHWLISPGGEKSIVCFFLLSL